MTEDLRECPGCGSEREFVRRHPVSGGCPDSADGWCPEWFCTGCGTALLAGVIPLGRDLAGASGTHPAGRLDRVA
jgi:hypothetical protein